MTAFNPEPSVRQIYGAIQSINQALGILHAHLKGPSREQLGEAEIAWDRVRDTFGKLTKKITKEHL